MLSEGDPNSLVEPWFALSKDRYRSILNQALSEMEPREPEGLVQADLPNCTELIKLLNQDDGLSSATSATASMVLPDAKRSARPAPNRPCDGKPNRFGAQQTRSLGSQLFSGGAKRKRVPSSKGNSSFGSLCKSVRKTPDGAQFKGCANGRISETSAEYSTTTLPRRTATIGRGRDGIQEHDGSLGKRRNVEIRDPPKPAAPMTNCEYPPSLPGAFSLRFHDNGRRPSDARYFQGHRSSTGGSVVGIPNRDLSRSKLVPIVKAEEELWSSCSNSFPCAFQDAKVEPKEEFSTISEGKKKQKKKKKILEHSILRPPSCIADGRNNIPPMTTSTDRKDSSSAEMTSRHPAASGVGVEFPVGVIAPFVELLNSDQSVIVCCASRRTDPIEGHETNTAPPIRVIPCRLRAAFESHFGHSPASSYSSSRPNARNISSATRYSNNIERGEVRLLAPPGGENTLLGDGESGASSPGDLLGVPFEPRRLQRGTRSSKRGSPSLRRDSELWAAFDKSMVNSMMQQILDEEDAIKHRLKQTHLNENEEDDEEEEEEEDIHLCPNGLVAEVDPVKRTMFPPGVLSPVLRREANGRVLDHCNSLAERRSIESNAIRCGVNGISKSDVSSQEFVRDLRIKSKSMNSDKTIITTTTTSSSSSSSNYSLASRSDDRYTPGLTTTRMPALSLIAEAGTGEKFQNCETLAFSAQKLGMSRMSFKWKSKMLNRLRRDQITANKWCMSETLSA